MKANFTDCPSRSRPRLFLGCPVPPSASSLPASTARSLPARASADHDQGRPDADRQQTSSPNRATAMYAPQGLAMPAHKRRNGVHETGSSSLDENWIDDPTRYKLIRALIEAIKTFRSVQNVKII